MQYIIAFEQGEFMQKVLIKLEKNVAELCKDGWRPQGGVSITSQTVDYNGNVKNYASQALIKE